MSPFDLAWLAASAALATPLAFAAVGEMVAERAGVINVGLEGMVLVGAFFSYWVVSGTDSLWLGVLCGAAAGAALSALMALFSLRLKGDQIVVGIGLSILALGITNALFEELFVGEQSTLRVPRFEALAVPLLSDIPVIGRVLFQQNTLSYLLFFLVPAVAFVLYRTTWGLAIRSVGEAPAAAEAAGINVTAVRTMATLFAGVMGGLAGTVLSIGQLGLFVQGMSGGRGFLALAAVIFGRWRPLGVIGACLLFGAAEALQLRLQAEPSVPAAVWLGGAVVVLAFFIRRVLRSRAAALSAGKILLAIGAAALCVLFVIVPNWRLPASLWLALPPVLALTALVTLRGRARAPAMLGVPYVRDSDAAV